MSFHIVTIEGNIGTGKTTKIQLIKERLESKGYNVKLIKEPVDECLKIVDKEGVNILERFYQDKSKYAFTFQIMALLTRYKIIKDIYIKENGGLNNIEFKNITNMATKTIYLSERTILTDKYIFAKTLHKEGFIDDMQMTIYEQWFDNFSKLFYISTCIYLRTSPEISYERVLKRQRPGEDISLEYLTELHKSHDKFIYEDLVKYRTSSLTVDSSCDINSEKYNENIEIISNNIIDSLVNNSITTEDFVNKTLLVNCDLTDTLSGMINKCIDGFSNLTDNYLGKEIKDADNTNLPLVKKNKNRV